MAPSATSPVEAEVPLRSKGSAKVGLNLTGALDNFVFDEVTPVIGREYTNTNIVDDILSKPNADELLKDLAITISQRGVVFFRKQDNLTNELQKEFVHRLGQVTGKPSTSTLHIHPIINDSRELGGADPEISTISSIQRKKIYTPGTKDETTRYSAAQWHSDIQFEPVPADYTSLRLVQLPKTGGDTVWASGYEIYDRISEPYQKFLETLTATYSGAGFRRIAATGEFPIYDKPRGSPDNAGTELEAVHPVVRTNPVSGWKSIFSVGTFPNEINGLSKSESDDLLKWFRRLITENHDLQVRFKWKDENDVAVWDNRSAFHSATFDYEGLGERFGNRAVGIGEKPYFDPNSKSRRQAIAEAEAARA